MLILVTVTVNVAMNGGLFNKAQTAKLKTDRESERETLTELVLGAYDAVTGLVNFETLERSLLTGWEYNDGEVTTKKGNIFYVDSKGNISDTKSMPEWIYMPNGENDNGDEIFMIIYTGNSTNVTIPQTIVAERYEWSEEGDDTLSTGSLDTISISGNIIGFNGHQNITSLVSVDFNNIDNITIGGQCFEGANFLESVTGLEGVTEVIDQAFKGCSSLESISFPSSLKGLKTMGSNVFKGSGLTSIELPNTFTSIQIDTFANANYLTNIEIDKTESECLGFPIGWNNGATVTYQEGEKTLAENLKNGDIVTVRPKEPDNNVTITLDDSKDAEWIMIGNKCVASFRSASDMIDSPYIQYTTGRFDQNPTDIYVYFNSGTIALGTTITESGWYFFDGTTILKVTQIPSYTGDIPLADVNNRAISTTNFENLDQVFDFYVQ